MVRFCTTLSLAAWILGSAVAAAPQQGGDDFVPLFNGRDLTGWENVNCAPDTFTVKDGIIHSTGKPICALRTDRMYENFVLELEYQHREKGGNAGLFIWADALPARGQPFLRAIEVQILDGRNSEYYTSHGDVFAIHGARMTPDRPHPRGAMRSLPIERRAKPAGEWNHYRVTAKDGRVTLAVNGREVSGGYDISPRKGFIALEAEEAPTLFRNIRIRELPSSGSVPPEDTARPADGFKSIYTGTSFDGWRVREGDGWKVNDWRIDASPAASAPLWTAADCGDVAVMLDWRCRTGEEEEGEEAKEEAGPIGRLLLRGSESVAVELPCGGGDRRGWNRGVIRLEGQELTVEINGAPAGAPRTIGGAPPRGPIGLAVLSRPAQFANLFVKTLD